MRLFNIQQYLKICVVCVAFTLVNCTQPEKTDEVLLQEDKDALAELLDSYKVNIYKFAKIALRSSVAKDEDIESFKPYQESMQNITDVITKDDEDLSLMEYYTIYKDYKKIEEFVEKTDEDIYPTVLEAVRVLEDSTITKPNPYLVGEEKVLLETSEHAALSVVTLLSKNIGKEIALYECSETQTEKLPDGELKGLLQYLRGLVFFEKQLFYLSEKEISDNINWLNTHKNIRFPFTKALFGWYKLSDADAHVGFHSINHLFRGFDRLMMDRAIDEERALQDFEVFLEDSHTLGVESEVVWMIEVYVHLKREQHQKAIASLRKLKTSTLLDNDEKESIDEAIAYLESRKSDEVLNRVYDRYFMSKIATKYMFAKLAKIDWEKVLKDNEVPNAEEISEAIENFKEFTEDLSTYSATESLKEEGENLWNKAKKLTE
ncbi:short-chain dehydrogenase [Neptunitalea lumnitzerae]|uniref:Short-chain dehydrogenase n=1 Tax=Neptunitalea lumnitzerae TaxID=2965509 RepID=A0ABQ5MLR7_9FLAO|nr:short-chain dehydrogenase [Neptunitalea sp. Y10]GLB50313.1 hypothetical protein Y10_26810 [Neptunitalea sp. Y10]